MYLNQLGLVALIALVCSASCLPAASRERVPGTRRTHLEGRTPYHYHGIIWKKLLPVLQTAFTNAVTGVIANWFYPWRVIPYPSGKIGIAQLWGGTTHHHGHYYGRRRRSSDLPLEAPGRTTS